MAGELPDDVKATLSILDQPQPTTPAKLKPTRTMDDIALPIRAPRADDVQQTLSILDGNTPPETNSGPNQRDVEADVLKLALRKGVNSNTALAAHRKNVAQKLNINPALVTPQAEESAFYQDHDPTDLQKNYPALAKYLQVDGNAELVGKNIDPLKEIETFYRRSENDPAIMLAKGAIGVASTVVGLGNLVSAGKAGKYIEDQGIDFKKIQSVLSDLYTPESQAAVKDIAGAKGFLGTLEAAAKNPSAVGLWIGESLPQMYLGTRVLGGALLSAFPAMAPGTAGAIGEGLTMAGGSAEQIRRETDTGELTPGQTALAVGVGVIGTGLSKFGNVLATKLGIEDVDAAMVAGKLLTRLEDSGVPKQLAVRLIGGAAVEGGVEEMPQSVTEQIAQNVALGRPWDEGVPENAAIGLVTGGVMGAAAQVGAARGKAPITVEETPAEKQARATIQNSILRTAAAVNAEEQRNALKEWGKRVSADNPLRKESPQSFKEFVRTMADENGAIKEVFVDAKLLNETLGQAGIDKDKLAADMPEVAESLNEALVTNGEVRIPIEDYATHIVGTPVEQAILDHLRTTPDGMTYAESQVFFQQQQEDFVKQAESLINLNEPVLTRKEFTAQAPEGMQYKDYLQAHKNKVEAFATDLKEVHDSLLTGLESTGRFPKSISRVYAIPFREFYATNAARMGILPTELYKSLPLNFAKMQTADILAPSVLSQDEIEKRLVAQHNISVPNLIHADRMGGLAAPSLAITDKAHTFDSFGDITLISSKDMIDPRSGAKVFGADIYSPRYPRVDYAFSKDRVVRLNEQLKDQFALTNEKPIEVYDINGDASDAARTLENNAAVMAAFLESKKIKPKLAKVKKRAIPRWALKYADKTMYSYIDTPAFIEDVAKHTEHIDEILSRAENEEERSLMRRRLANSKAYEIDAYRTDRPNFGKVDPKASLSEMNRQIYDKGLHKEYTSYVYNLTLSMNPTERIFKGFTNSGSRKYIPHTIDNVIAELRKNLRGGENFNYGLGSIRARYTPQFKTLEQIRKAEGKLLSSEDFERVKTELDSEFNAVLEELTRYYKHKGSAGFGLYEIGSQALTDAASLGVPRALKENQFENVPQEAQNRIADFLAKLADVPAEYFEVKLLRQVGLQEFSGAVVPKNAGQNVIDILKKNGITDIKFYKPQDKADRLAKVNEFNDLFFQSAFYSALQREIPSISKIADKNGMVKADQALSWVEARQKEGKFKLEEVEAVGLKDWLQATEGKVSVADIENFVAENGVQIEEKLLGEELVIDEDQVFDKAYQDFTEDNPQETGESDEEYQSRWEAHEDYYRTFAREQMESVGSGSETKFEAYKLPGGENYRELLLTLPRTEGQDFKSAHYDEKNILAHVRFDDRTNPTTGQKILFIEEIQSDWAQEGRKKGFAKITEQYQLAYKDGPTFGAPYADEASARAELRDTFAGREDLEVRKVDSRLIGTPAAPFVQNTKSWVALAVKRMLRYAAENGYDQIAWTTGGQQAARYDLSKQISEIRYSHGYLKAYDLDNNLVLNKSSVREDELPDIIGKEVAKKLLDQPEEGPGKMRVLSGPDLKVGGEGMLAFYDKLLPQVVSDVAKKLGGGKVGSVAITPQAKAVRMPHGWVMQDEKGNQVAGPASSQIAVEELYRKEGLAEQPSLEITPEMRDKIMSGLPLFQGQRAGFDPSTFTMSLLKGADLSSVIHEGAHFYLEALADLAGRDTAPQQIKDDFRTTLNWFGITGNEPGVPGGSTLEQKAFHGSPHSFDKFSTANIGTGEGAQAYGYGLYFTDSKEVAEFYKGALENSNLEIDGEAIPNISGGHRNVDVIEKLLVDSYGLDDRTASHLALAFSKASSKPDVLKWLNNRIEMYRTDNSPEAAKQMSEVRDTFEALPIKIEAKNTGKLYEVELAPEQDEYLLWDKPLSEQSDKVKRNLKSAVAEINRKSKKQRGVALLDSSSTGADIYRAYARYDNTPTGGTEKAASDYLHSIGIRGIKYLDGTSRGKGEGSYNYVIFSDNDVEIQAYYQSAKLPETINVDGVERPTMNSNGKPIYPTEDGIRNFWKWFGDSKVVDKQGRPLVVYHGTAADFNTFKRRRGDIGIHFGTVAQAGDRIKFKTVVGADTTGQNVQPEYLAVSRLLRLKDLGAWDYDNVSFGLEDAGFGSVEIRSAKNLTGLRELIRSKGYQGIVYKNTGEVTGMAEAFAESMALLKKAQEATGARNTFTPEQQTHPAYLDYKESYNRQRLLETKGEDSYIVFNPNQIKSAIGNTGAFDPNNPNILRQGGETQQPPSQLPPGATPEEIWSRMTLDQKRPYHEQWAQSYERYTLEGKAPTVEMQSVFSRFREWMLSVYKSMKDFLAQNPLAGKLNDDIRGVFDRLIASEDKIYQAEEARGYASLFGSAAEAGLSESEYENYQTLGKMASMRAIDEMNGRSIRDMRWLSNAKDKTIKKLQAEAKTKRAAVIEQVTDEVDAMPLNRARNFLTKGEFIDEAGVRRESETKFKLNEAEVKALSNGTVPAGIKNMVSPDGIGLELAAKLLGFQSPETLVYQLVNGESRDVTIQGLTDQKMLEQYGDLTDDKAIERAAEKAIHNDARARFMATGLKLLTKTELSAAQLNRAAKMAAEATIAKKKIRAINPGQFTRAEAKANREAIENVAHDPKKAIDAQRAALLNNRLAKAALDAADDVDSILKYFKKFESKGVRKAVGIDQIDQIDDLLQEVDRDKNLPLKEIDKRQALADWVAEQEADGFEPVLDPVQAEQIKAKHYKDMTVDELRMLRDTVKQIEHVGRLKQTLLTEMERADFRARVAEAENSIRANANRTVEEKGTPTDVVGETNRWVRQMLASHRKFSSFIREMDGGRDGGVMWRLLSKNMNAAGDNEVEMRRASSEAISELFKTFNQEKAPLNLYAKRTRIPGTDISMTQEQRIMFAMNWGNEGNRQRLLDGGIPGKRALSSVEADAVLNTLTKPEWDFVQGVWDHIATYKDQIAALERKITGIEPEWVEPTSIDTKYGTYRGGYFPAKYDVELSSRSESLEAAVDLRMGMKGAFNTAATRSGYTKQRSEAVMNRPLLLSYNVIANHISEVTHRLAWQPWLIDANRVLKALDAPIRQHYGAEVLREMRNTVNDIAAGDVGSRTPMEKAINYLRTGSTIVGMGWRFSTAFLQPSGLAQSWARIGGRWMAKGIAETFKNLNSASELVNSKSSLMRNRDITMNREVRDVLDRIRTNEGLNAITGSYFYLIGKMQQLVDIPTWLGAYEKALHDLKLENAVSAEERAQIESDAVALADQAVIDSQSGGQLKDLASIQRGHPGLKLFTNFYSYFSATYNLNIEALRRTNFRSPTDLAFLAGDLILLNIIPVLFATALKEMTKGKCGDDLDCLVKSYGYEQAGYMFGQMILLRDMGSAALVAAGGDQYGYSGPAGLRFFSDLYKAGVQVNQGELDWPLFKSLSNTTGVLLHLPTGQVNTTLEGIMAVENGDVEGVSILPALLFGPPKEGK